MRHEAAREMREGPSEPACRSGSNYLKLLWLKSHGGERCRKRHDTIVSSEVREMSARVDDIEPA